MVFVNLVSAVSYLLGNVCDHLSPLPIQRMHAMPQTIRFYAAAAQDTTRRCCPSVPALCIPRWSANSVLAYVVLAPHHSYHGNATLPWSIPGSPDAGSQRLASCRSTPATEMSPGWCRSSEVVLLASSTYLARLIVTCAVNNDFPATPLQVIVLASLGGGIRTQLVSDWGIVAECVVLDALMVVGGMISMWFVPLCTHDKFGTWSARRGMLPNQEVKWMTLTGLEAQVCS